MVKENGMVMMSEEEYRNLIGKTHQLDNELDIAKMELSTYRSAMKKLSEKNLGIEAKEDFGIEIPANHFVDLIDNMSVDWMKSDGMTSEEKLQKLEDTDLWFAWNGFCARIPYGCEICNEVLPAIKEAYDQYND